MKKTKVHTLSELKIYSEEGTPENEVNGNMIDDSVITTLLVEDTRYVNIRMTQAGEDISIIVNLQYSIEQIEQLHSWLGILLKNKTTKKIKKTKKTKKA